MLTLTPDSTGPTLSSESMSGMGEAGTEARLSWTAVSLLLCSRALMLRPRPTLASLAPGAAAAGAAAAGTLGSRLMRAARLGTAAACRQTAEWQGYALFSVKCPIIPRCQVKQPQDTRISRKSQWHVVKI